MPIVVNKIQLLKFYKSQLFKLAFFYESIFKFSIFIVVSSQPILNSVKYMKTKMLLLLAAFTLQTNMVNAQDFQEPTDGKAVIYFLRTSGLGAAINFKYFIDEEYLGKFSGKNYARIEVDPGEHLVWAKSENLDFMKADLKANAIYLVHVKPKMGGFKAAVRLEVPDLSDAKLLTKIKKLIAKKKPVTLNMKKAEKEVAKIKEYLEKYEKRRNSTGENQVKVLSADMNFSN